MDPREKLKQAHDTAMRLEKEFKDNNKNLESKYDAVLVAQEKKMEEALDKIESKMNDLALAAKRPESAGSDAVEKKAEAWARVLKTGRMGEIERKDLAVTSADPKDGSYLVPRVVYNQILETLDEQSFFRNYATKVTTEGSDLEFISRTGKTGALWVGETAARPKTGTPEFDRFKIELKEIYSMPLMTQQSVEDMGLVNLVEYVNRLVAEEFAEKENIAFLTGDGITAPTGLLTSVTSMGANRTQVGATETAATGVIGFEDLVDLQHNLNQRYASRAVFMGNKKTYGALRKIKNENGDFIWELNAQLGMPATILGSEFVINPDMPEIAASEIALVYGDLAETYTIVDKPNSLIYQYDDMTARPFIGLYHRMRVGGGVTNGFASVALQIKA